MDIMHNISHESLAGARKVNHLFFHSAILPITKEVHEPYNHLESSNIDQSISAYGYGWKRVEE